MMLRLALTTLLAVVSVPVCAQVPSELRAAVLVRALGYERALRGGDGDIRLVVASDGSGASDADSMMQAFGDFAARSSLGGRRLVVERADLSNVANVTRQDPHVVYVANGTGAAAARQIAHALPPGRIVVCGDTTLLGQGCVLAVERAASRARLVVHMPSTRRSGVDWDARLLRLARIVR